MPQPGAGGRTFRLAYPGHGKRVHGELEVSQTGSRLKLATHEGRGAITLRKYLSNRKCTKRFPNLLLGWTSCQFQQCPART